ncbi:MAG: hypothetical protein E6493_04500, partial [Alloscardovia omnicolens]|nr:hypothetical protein [Alloscardovia omnicolens]
PKGSVFTKYLVESLHNFIVLAVKSVRPPYSFSSSVAATCVGPTLKFCSWYFYYALFTVILPNILAIFYEEKWESSQLKIYF